MSEPHDAPRTIPAPRPGLAISSTSRTATPAVSRHPNAQLEVRLSGHLVAYALKRGRRRSIGFVVGMDGLSVSAPKWVGLTEIDTALQEKGDWILRKIREQQERARRLLAAKVEWRDGVIIPYLGESLVVVLDERAGSHQGGAVLGTDSDSHALSCARRLTLRIGLPRAATPGEIRDAVLGWLQCEARRLFEDRCRHFTQQLGVQYKRLSLSSAQTRWGSASVDGSIRLNWRLIHFALPTIDYVVAHELAHLREMNHSPRFWDVVRSVVPDFKKARGNLKDHVLPVFD